ncbi:MAG TPA: nuclear transport factor 2 family protein, partial [Thermoanaerobaculia bacterium]|nr:nuclear transport factor 2 family protein [Thermoanaerobaculia bacterium]
ILSRERFIAELRPLPAGLSGEITVKELTVQEISGAAIVRFLADEKETVFGQKLATKYRITDTWKREGEGWKLVASHASVVTQDPAEQPVSKAAWPAFVGRYRLLPDGWTFTVELRDGALWGGRDPKKLRRMIPLAPDAFVVSGSLGEWIFVTDDKGRVVGLMDFRKFEPLYWTRLAGETK